MARSVPFAAVVFAVLVTAGQASATPTSGHGLMRGVAGPRDGVRGIDGATGARTVDAVRSRLARARADEGRGRLVAALSASRSALALAESSSLRVESEEAQSRVLFLEQAVPRVVLSGALPAGARVSIDGRPLPLLEATSGTLVDPGEHDVAVAVPGRATWRGRFRVERGDRKEIGVQVGPELGVSLGSRPEGLDVAVRPDAPRVDGWSGLLASYRLGLRPQRSLQRPPAQPTGPIVYGGCTLVPCAVSGPSGDDRVDKRLFSSMLRESGLNLVATNGVLLVTASSELLATNTRVGASMMPDGTRYFAFTGSWLRGWRSLADDAGPRLTSRGRAGYSAQLGISVRGPVSRDARDGWPWRQEGA